MGDKITGISFYDKNGKPIAYSEDDVHIFLFTGEPRAYIDGISIYSYPGKHIGWFIDGWIRDHSGNCVMFSEKASGGPIKPIKQIKPIKGIKQIKPIKRIKQIKPILPIKSLSWSNVSGIVFFRQ